MGKIVREVIRKLAPIPPIGVASTTATDIVLAKPGMNLLAVVMRSLRMLFPGSYWQIVKEVIRKLAPIPPIGVASTTATDIVLAKPGMNSLAVVATTLLSTTKLLLLMKLRILRLW